MSLSTQARRHIEVAVADEKIGKEVADAIDAVTPATASAVGGVKVAANVAKAAGAAPTAAEFKALLDALIAAGVMAPAA